MIYSENKQLTRARDGAEPENTMLETIITFESHTWNALFAAKSTNDTRYYLDGMHLCVRPGPAIIAETSNAHILLRLELDQDSIQGDAEAMLNTDQSVIIPMPKKCPKTSTVTVAITAPDGLERVNDDGITVVSPPAAWTSTVTYTTAKGAAVSHAVEPIDGRFPDTNRVIPDKTAEPDGIVCANPRYLSEVPLALAANRDTAPRICVRMSVGDDGKANPGGPFLVEICDYPDATFIVMPCRK